MLSVPSADRWTLLGGRWSLVIISVMAGGIKKLMDVRIIPNPFHDLMKRHYCFSERKID